MSRYVNINREGFWASAEDTSLPTPMSVPWNNKTIFLRLLMKVEKKAERKTLKGWSSCRMCGAVNGSEELQFAIDGNVWAWPIGLWHYIDKHQVRPSLAFEEFINKAGENTL